MASRMDSAFRRFDQAELALCQSMTRLARPQTIRQFFVVLSRLGDGLIWYGLMVFYALWYGVPGVISALHMGVVALAGVALYKFLKKHAVRERPFITHNAIDNACAPLDRYSFPSGHTLHAVSFTCIALTYHPEWAVFLVPFAILVALSRVALGLHYPTDVAAGALIGGALALVSLVLVELLIPV